MSNISVIETRKTAVTPTEPNHCPIAAVICIVMSIGIILNFIAVYTYLKKPRRKSTHIFTMCLAIVDFFNSLNLTLLVARLFKSSTSFEGTVCTVQDYLTDSGTIISGCLVVAIAFERCRKVSRPYSMLARKKYWTIVIVIALAGFAVSFAKVLYILLGYGTACGTHNRSKDENSGFEEVLENADTLFPVIFSAVVILVLFVGFVLIITQYTKINKVVRLKQNFGHKYLSKSDMLLDKDTCVVACYDGNMDSSCDSDRVLDVVDKSPVCVIRDHITSTAISNLNNKSQREQTVFTIFSDEYYSQLSQLIVQHPICVQQKKVTKEKQSDIPNRRESTASITVRKKPSSKRTMFMLCFAIISYLLYFPRFSLKIMDVLLPSLIANISSELNFLYELFEYSYIYLFILNPILYTFFNRGFFNDFLRAFGCNTSDRSSVRTRSSSLSSQRNSYNVSNAQRYSHNTCMPLAGEAQLKPDYARPFDTKQYPYLVELGSRLQKMSMVVDI